MNNSEKLHPGELVRFSEIKTEDDRTALMEVVEDRDTRVLVRDLRHKDWAIWPTAVYAKTDLARAEGND